MKNFVKVIYKDVVAIIVMMIVVVGLIFVCLDMDKFSLDTPISYDGGDGMSYLVNAAMLMEGNTTMESDRMGAPYGYQGYDFYASSLHNVDNWILKIIVQFTDNPATAVNIMFLTLFPMISLFSYFVLRQFKIRPWVSSIGAVTYSFMPYLFMRGIDHFVLTSYYFVPVSILFSLWIYTDDNFFAFNKKFFVNWKNYFAIVMCFFIANNGISYYPFFTCYFLIIVGIIKMIKEKKLGYLLKSFIHVVMIVFWMLIALLPNMLYIRANGINKAAVERTVDAVETYGLKIAQLFIPSTGHGIEFFDDLIYNYEENMPLVNENCTAYLGVMASIGFLALLVVLFLRHIKEENLNCKLLSILSILNIAGVLLGTIGGFGSLFGILVTDMIRCYNRISIFLAFVDIMAVCILLQMLMDKLAATDKLSPKVKMFVSGLCSLFCIILSIGGILFQYPGERFDYVTFAEYYKNDKAFVEEIEKTVPAGSMIFQLPYHEYPEGGVINEMADYDLWIGYLHSKTLKWSYGGVLGRENDNWLATIDYESVPNIIKAAKSKGFAGIYIDRRAYDDEGITVLEEALSEELGVKRMISENGALSFYRFK